MKEIAEIENSTRIHKKEILEKIMVVVYAISIYTINVAPQFSNAIKYIVLPICILALFNTKSFDFLIFPLTFLDDSFGTLIMGRITFIWIYFALFMFKKLYIICRRSNNNFYIAKSDLWSDLATIFLSFYFTFFGVLEHGMPYIKCFFVVLCVLGFRNDLKSGKTLSKLQFIIIVFSLVPAISVITGQGGHISYFNRRIGFGFTDPNYCSSICLVGLCASLFINKKGVLRFLNVVIPGIFIIAVIICASLTGVTIAVGLIVLKIWTEGTLAKKVKYISTIILFSLLAFVVFAPKFGEEFFSSLTNRFDFLSLNSNLSINDLTSGRTSIAMIYMNYFFGQGFLKQLFGGNVLNCSSLFSKIGGIHVTHNTIIDHLIVFGILGTVVMYILYINRLRKYMERKKSDKKFYMIIFMKISVFLYSLTLAYLEVPVWWFMMLL